jgi:hypothetical protein
MTSSPVLSVFPKATEEEVQAVAELLGRSPRGLMAVSVCSASGSPIVIQVASLVENKPFPTLFWLVDKRLNYAIDQLEASGFIKQCQALIDQSPSLQERMAEDHRVHIALRYQLMSEQQKAVERLGFADLFQQRGIGGIKDFSRIRCLHTYYASHLVESNIVGAMVDSHWQAQGVHFDHLA